MKSWWGVALMFACSGGLILLAAFLLAVAERLGDREAGESEQGCPPAHGRWPAPASQHRPPTRPRFRNGRLR